MNSAPVEGAERIRAKADPIRGRGRSCSREVAIIGPASIPSARAWQIT